MTKTPEKKLGLENFGRMRDRNISRQIVARLLLVRYVETSLNRLELWLRDWRIAINILKSTAVLFAKPTRRVQGHRPPQLSESKHNGLKQHGTLG
jgi:hypothetical protein